jgi:hypothetical protein
MWGARQLDESGGVGGNTAVLFPTKRLVDDTFNIPADTAGSCSICKSLIFEFM